MKTEHTPGFWVPTLRIKSLLLIVAALLLVMRPVMGGEAATPAANTPTKVEAEPSSGSEPASANDSLPKKQPSTGVDTLKPYGKESIDAQTGARVIKQKVFKIDVGDKVTVKIYPEDDYLKGTQMEVSTEGNIVLPLLDRIEIKGLTIAEAEKKITDLIAQDYLVNPIVVIEVADRLLEKEGEGIIIKRSVSILGQVQKPGTYEFPPEGKMTLLEVISKAGGFTDVANVKKIKVIRKGEGKNSVISANAESIIGGRNPDVPLETDDVIHVGESFF